MDITQLEINKKSREDLEKEFVETYEEYREKVFSLIPEEKKQYWIDRINSIKSFNYRLEKLEKLEKYWSKNNEK